MLTVEYISSFKGRSTSNIHNIHYPQPHRKPNQYTVRINAVETKADMATARVADYSRLS